MTMARLVAAPSIVAIVALLSRLPPPPTPAEEGAGGGGSDWVRVALVAVLAISVAIVASLGLRPYFVRRERGETADGLPTEEGEASASEPRPERGAAEDQPVPPRNAAPDEPAAEASGPAAAPVALGPVDAETMAGLTNTVQQLLGDANAGDYARGFGLYTPAYFARFLAESGLSDEEIAALPPPPPEERTELRAITDLEPLAADRVAATIAYAPKTGEPAVAERYVFVRDADGRWQIDDISPLPLA